MFITNVWGYLLRKIKEHMGEDSAITIASIDSSNFGFKLLKKHGWKEWTGFGVSEYGRLELVQASLKKNKRGLGAWIEHLNVVFFLLSYIMTLVHLLRHQVCQVTWRM